MSQLPRPAPLLPRLSEAYPGLPRSASDPAASVRSRPAAAQMAPPALLLLAAKAATQGLTPELSRAAKRRRLE